MLLLDVLIRYSAIAIMTALAILAIRDGWRAQPTRLAAYLSLSMVALLLSTAPEELRPPSPVLDVLRVIDIPNVALIWWLGLSLFNDDFKLRRLEWAGMAIYVALVAMFRLRAYGVEPIWPGAFDIALDVLSFAMIGHVIWIALSGRNEDLVEPRRRTRLWFALALAAATAAAVFGEAAFDDSPWLSTFRAAVALPLATWGLLWLTSLHPERMLFQPVAKAEPIGPSVDPKDAATHRRLISIMEDDRAFAEPGLTIGALAERVGAPEHQLRALINRGLGFRNFAAFLNQYRLQDVKAAFADPERARTPILTLAMDAGFGSLASFNRAFKAVEGVTPGEYRAKALRLTDRN
ncbi:MAG: helix-turn-helix domain-containing protein [Pseudomonadota bacterium]